MPPAKPARRPPSREKPPKEQATRDQSPGRPTRPRGPRPDPRLARRRQAVGREAGRRRLILACSTLAAIAFVVGVLVVVHSSLFSVRHLEVVGNRATPSAAIVQASGLSSHPPLVDVNPAAVASAIEKLPWIATATVSRHWPDTVHIAVTERSAVAAWTLRPGSVVLLDQRARVLALVASAPPGVVPVSLSGPIPEPGTVLGTGDRAVVKVAAALPVALLDKVASIGGSASGVLVRLRSGPVADFGQATDLTQKMVALSSLLDSTSVTLGPHASIDLRVPDEPVVTS